MSLITDRHSTDSSLREEYTEYTFLAGLCRVAWQRNRPLEILRCQTDARGYDLILEANNHPRHVQLKASKIGAKTSTQKISTLLGDKLSGCVVWIWFDENSLTQDHFLFFGAAPGMALPDLGTKVAKHTKGNRTGHKAERSNHRVLNKGTFEKLLSYEDVFDRLFGLA